MKLIGDVHSKYGPYKKLIKDNPGTIQVGDLGLGFRKWPHGEFSTNPPYDEMVKADARFIRGNHDNPFVCRNNTQCIKDGTVIDDVMFIGGAYSIDWMYRVEDFNWWKDEELSQQELELLIEVYQTSKPKMMVTHDCPTSIYHEMHSRVFDQRGRTPGAFEAMLNKHPPEVWVFGHHHVSFDKVVDGTRFVCLAELEMKEI